MLILTSNEQAAALVKDGVLEYDGDIRIAFDEFRLDASLLAGGNIRADDGDIYAVGDIQAEGNLLAGGNIRADDGDIYAAGNITYYDLCRASYDINCNSIEGRGEGAKHFSVNGMVVVRGYGNSN